MSPSRPRPWLRIAAVIVLLALASTAAGAVFWPKPPPPKPAHPEPLRPLALEDVLRHNASGLLPLPRDTVKPSVAINPMMRNGTEPTIGVTPRGTLLVSGLGTGVQPSVNGANIVAQVYRSENDGQTWTDVASTPSRPDFDPYLLVDPFPSGGTRVFSLANVKACSWLLYSDDDGKDWGPGLEVAGLKLGPAMGEPFTGCNSRPDHESLASGPPAPGVQTPGYPHVLYYAFNAGSPPQGAPGATLGGTRIMWSLDGGSSWEPTEGQQVFPADDCHGGLNGAPAVGPNGVVYVPKPRCRDLSIAVSRDGGRTWETRTLDAAGIGGGGADGATGGFAPNPSVALDARGNAYAAWTGRDGQAWLSASTDNGTTWSAPTRATPPPIHGTVFSALVAGDDGRVAVAYLGTTSPAWQGNLSQAAPDATRWDLYVTFAENATSADPTYTTLRVTPSNLPVQIGKVFTSGDPAARNLGDFVSVAQRGGRVLVAYTDGCGGCADAAGSHKRMLTTAIVLAGPTLRG